MKIVFVGASSFGYRCLEEILTLPQIEVAGIISNRQTFAISYNKSGVTNVLYKDFSTLATEKNIPFYRMEENMKEAGLSDFLAQSNPDLCIVVGWYHMVPGSLLDQYRFAGLHASLLPDYSGGAPLVWAIINGETKTGITFFFFDRGVDSGDIIGQKETEIFPEDTIKTLYDRIEVLGIDLLKDALPQMAIGQLTYQKQDESKRRVFPQRNPADGLINWTWDAKKIKNFIRAQTKPYPGAFTIIEGKKVIIWDADIIEEENI